MFIRRNMSSNVSYQQLKEYPCFKQLAKSIDVLILKQILPMVVKKVSLDVAKQTINRKKMMYIPEQILDNRSSVCSIDSTISGTEIDSILKSKNQSKMKFFMIEIKIYNILKHLFYKNIECMQHLKSFQKLNFFYRSGLDQIPFGGYIYRKNDQITSIYYLVRGEVKIAKSVDQNEIGICSIYEGTFFGVYEFSINKTQRMLNAQSYSNKTIVLNVSLDMLTELFGREQNEALNRLLALPSEVQKKSIQESRKLNKNEKKEKRNSFIKAYEFQRRLNKFSEERSIDRKESAFGKFVQNKSLLFKIKDSNDFIPCLKKQTTKAVSNFHRNQISMKYCDRLNQHRLFKLDSSISRTFADKENMVIDNKKMVRPSQLLSSRLRKRFDTSRQFFSSGVFSQIYGERNSQV